MTALQSAHCLQSLTRASDASDAEDAVVGFSLISWLWSFIIKPPAAAHAEQASSPLMEVEGGVLWVIGSGRGLPPTHAKYCIHIKHTSSTGVPQLSAFAPSLPEGLQEFWGHIYPCTYLAELSCLFLASL